MTAPLVITSPEDLSRIVREAVAAELEERSEAPDAPLLVTRPQMAKLLAVGVDTLDRLRREGCPEVMVGDMPRFLPAEVLTWLRERGAQ